MNLRKPFLLLGTPNSGTDWLSRCIGKVTGWAYYEKEFFNPITNPIDADTLLEAFGCEMVSGMGNLATCNVRQILEVVVRMWPTGRYDFNKEVWSFAKLPALAVFFDCMVITRTTESLFPPSRLRVWQWYDTIWHALKRSPSPRRLSLQDRAREGHALANSLLHRDASMIGVPVVSYDDLTTASPSHVLMLCRSIAERWPIDPNKLADEIVATRRPKAASLAGPLPA